MSELANDHLGWQSALIKWRDDPYRSERQAQHQIGCFVVALWRPRTRYWARVGVATERGYYQGEIEVFDYFPSFLDLQRLRNEALFQAKARQLISV